MAGGRSFAPNPKGALVTDLVLAARDRLDDSKVLLAAGRSAMAIAAGLYALEIRLKVLICQQLDILNLPKAFEIHDLDELLVLTGLSRKIEDPSLSQVKINWDEILVLSLNLNDLRYSPDARWPIQQTKDFLSWLEDADHGVLTWLSTGP